METNEHPSQTSPFIPVLTLSVALVLLLGWQLLLAWQTRTNLRQQFEQRQELVEQSQLVQQNVQSLVSDLLDLATTDEDARRIVEKYNIRRN
jgi:hypothetical protein